MDSGYSARMNTVIWVVVACALSTLSFVLRGHDRVQQVQTWVCPSGYAISADHLSCNLVQQQEVQQQQMGWGCPAGYLVSYDHLRCNYDPKSWVCPKKYVLVEQWCQLESVKESAKVDPKPR